MLAFTRDEIIRKERFSQNTFGSQLKPVFTVQIKGNRGNGDTSKIILRILAIVQILLNISDNDFSTEVVK